MSSAVAIQDIDGCDAAPLIARGIPDLGLGSTCSSFYSLADALRLHRRDLDRSLDWQHALRHRDSL